MAVARLGAIAAGLIAVAVASVTTLGPVAASMLTGAGHVSNPAPPRDIALAPLEQRSRVLASDGAELAVLHGEYNRELVALAELPPIVPAAVITAEDRRFAEHAGYDPRGIARAALTNLREGRMAAGGSTITQQVAKANFTDGARTLKRKLVELGYARALEAQLSKDEILERYLNEVYVGRGAYGMAAGAQAFFGRDVADLEVHHAALLAGMIAAPEHFDPIRHPELATARRNHVLAGMVDEDHLNPVRADLAAIQPLDVVAFHRLQPRDPYVVEQVKRELLVEPALGDTRQQRIDALFSGGLQIHTSIDWRLQEHADGLISEALGDAGPTAALLLMEAANGRIVVARSGQDFRNDQFDPALQGRRQPGSAFKTFVLATALEQGMALDDPVNASSPALLEFGGRRPWHVSNYANRSYGTIPLQAAFARSSNTAFARLILRTGQTPVEDLLARLGIDVDRALGAERGLSPAIALGGVAHGMTLPEMAAAFGALTGDGQLVAGRVVTKVTASDGTVLVEHVPEPRRAVAPQVAAQTRDAMRAVVESGTGRRARIDGREVVGKTGTSQQFADAWFVGESDGLVGAAWVGHPDGQIPMDRMTGGQLPAELWRGIVTAALDAQTAGR